MQFYYSAMRKGEIFAENWMKIEEVILNEMRKIYKR